MEERARTRPGPDGDYSVRQVAELGLIPFLWRYGSEYLRYRRSGLSRDQAYRAISFERDAFAAERDDSV